MFGTTAGAGGNNTLVATGIRGRLDVQRECGQHGDGHDRVDRRRSGDTLNQTGGALDATVYGNGKALDLTDVKTVGTTINSNGSGETFDLTESGGVLNLNPATTGNSLTINGVSNNYDQSFDDHEPHHRGYG